MGRRSIPNRFLIILVALVVFLGLAHLATRRISTGPLRTRIEKKLTQALGLEITLAELRVALLPTPHLEAEGVRIANFPGRPSPNLLRIDRLDLGIRLWPLLEGIVVIDALSIERADLYIETDSEGRLADSHRLGAKANDGAEKAFRLELRQLHIDTLRVFYQDGRDGVSRSLVLDSIAVETKDLGDEISLEAQGQFEGSQIALSGQIGSLRELLKPTQPFPVDLTGQLFEAHFEAKGTVRTPRTLEGLDLEIAAEIPELVVLGQSLPQLGTIRFRGQLSNLDGSLGLETFSLSGSSNGPVRIDVHGKLDDLLELKEIDVEAHLKTGPLDFFAPLLQPRVDFPLPAIASLSLQAKLSDKNGSLGLDVTFHAATPGNAIVIHAEGFARDLTRVAQIDIKLDGKADDLASITALFPDVPTHGPLGAVTASGHLKSQDGVLGADEIKIRLGGREKVWANLDGSIADVVALRGVDLELAFGSVSLHHLKELLARELPRTTPFEGAAGIRDKDGSLGMKHLRLHGGEKSPVEIHLDARFDGLPGRDAIEIELGLRSQDTRVLGAIAGVDLPTVGPVEFHGKVHGSEEHLEAESLVLRLGESRFAGSVSVSFAPHARPAVKARLTSKDVRLQDLGLTRSQNRSASPSADWPKASDGRVRLPFERLRHVDLDLGLQLDHVGGYAGFDANDVRFMLRLEDGNLVVTDAGATYQEGRLSAELSVDARTPIPKLKIELKTTGMNLARVMSQFQKETDFSGFIDADVNLQASGGTLDALRQSLNGSFGVAVRDGNAASQIARAFVVNLVTAVFRGLRSKNVPSIGCGVIQLEIEDGIATVHTLLLKEKEIVVTGTGQIDLVRGLYDLRVVPTTTNPGIVSVVPEVNVRGPLNHPSFHSVKRTLVTSFGRGLLKNALKAGGTLLRPFRSRSNPMKEHEESCRLTSPGLGDAPGRQD